MNFNKKTIKYFFISVFLAEYFSLIGHVFPLFNWLGFVSLSLILLAASVRKTEYGLWLIFTELFIGSFGRLYAINIFGFSLSLRIAFWLIFLFVWLVKELKNWPEENGFKKFFCLDKKKSQVPAFFVLFIFIAWGVLNGFLSHQPLGNIFADCNGWLYFALLFPVLKVVSSREQISALMRILLLSAVWLSIKTFFLLFIFSHNMIGIVPEFYAWIRDTRIGEITQMQGGFYRIFMQSHIFVLIAYFLELILLASKIRLQPAVKVFSKENIFDYFLIIIFSAVNLISLSRSNWLGLAFGLGLFGLYLLYCDGLKKALFSGVLVFFLFLASIGLIVLIVKFPYPNPMGGFSTSELLSERAKQISGEAGVSSRWSLLPELWKGIKSAPFSGQGFGAAITYKSSDPRVLEKNPDGRYTTFAFEWGWLDIWLKLGFFGVLAYLYLLGLIIFAYFKNIKKQSDVVYGKTEDIFAPAFLIALCVIILINFFSPYLNHPLGIGFLLLVAVMAQTENSQKDQE